MSHRFQAVKGVPIAVSAAASLHAEEVSTKQRWEGNTLVVDTTNFTDKTSFRGSDRNLHLIARFTRTAPGAIIYQFTVDDPTAFTKSSTGEVPPHQDPGAHL